MNKNIVISGNIMTITFDNYDIANYELFMKIKKLPAVQIDYDLLADNYKITAPSYYAAMLGFDTKMRTDVEFVYPRKIFDYQKYIVDIALERKRYACYADTGLGKTLIFLTWCLNVIQITKRKVLILSPIQIIPQTISEPELFFDNYYIKHIHTRIELLEWLKSDSVEIAITNYEKLQGNELTPELQYLGGIAADESSIFKNGGGNIKWNIVKSSSGVEYKLSLSATPAPNDVFEYSSQLSFLYKDKMAMLNSFWSHFSKDKWGNWKVKEHSWDNLYQNMVTWSIYMRNPARFGFKDNDTSIIPEPKLFNYELGTTKEQDKYQCQINEAEGDGMFGKSKMGIVIRSKFSQLAKGFIYTKDAEGKRIITRVKSKKPQFVKELVDKEIKSGYKTLVWTVFDEESNILAELLDNENYSVATLTGKMKMADRIEIVERFRNGKLDCLISKASLLGYGLNLQVCRSMIYSGWDDSYERWYQSVRRAYRYGQKYSLRIHVPCVPNLEGIILKNILRKKGNFESQAEKHEAAYVQKMGVMNNG